MSLKCDGTRAETRFRLSAKRTNAFKSAAGRQFSRLLAAEVCGISGSNAGYNVFRGSVKWYWVPTASANFPFISPSVASPCAITFQPDSTAGGGKAVPFLCHSKTISLACKESSALGSAQWLPAVFLR